MAVHLRKDGFWNNITYNVPPFSVAGNWVDVTSSRFYLNYSLNVIEQAKRVYTNNTGKLMLVRAVPGASSGPSVDTGTYAEAFVDNKSVAIYRDNGTNKASQVRYELQFFVPNYSEYYVQCYDKYGSYRYTGITTVEWYEFIFQ